MSRIRPKSKKILLEKNKHNANNLIFLYYLEFFSRKIMLNFLEIFGNEDKALKYIFDNPNINTQKICVVCRETTSLRIRKSGNKNILIRECMNTPCRKRLRLKIGNIPCNIWLFGIFSILNSCSYQQLYILLGFSDSTISRLKIRLYEPICRFLCRRRVLLGGEGVIVEIDESVLSRRGIVRNPTTLSDEVADTVWILGCIDASRNFHVVQVENRTIDTIYNVLRSIIRPGSVLHTDGYASYPEVARRLNCLHRVVNHSQGFISEDGIHTNNIEGFWSHLKGQMRAENGVKRVNIDDWLIRYTFKRKFIVNSSREDFYRVYEEIIENLLE